MIMKLLKWFRTFVDFPLFLSTSPLFTSIGLKLRTPQNSSELFFSTYPCWNIKVLNFLNLGTHREIKKESNIKKESKAFWKFFLEGNFLNAICLMVAMLTARLGGLT